MKYNRHSIRLKGYDYSLCGAYFITICTYDKKKTFGKIIDNKFYESEFGNTIKEEWFNLKERFENLETKEFILMPNHIHGILLLNTDNSDGDSEKSRQINLSNIVGAYKSITSIKCLEFFKKKNPDKFIGKLWQRNYYEHIIRNETEYNKIGEYIITNPEHWFEDKLNNLP